MAWGYWSATSVSDRGRSPRREKEKYYQTLHPHQHQSSHQQQVHQTELPQNTYGIQQSDYGVIPGAAAVEEPPCSMMIQGGSFYSYSAATAAAAAAAATSRRISTIEGPSSSTSTGIQVYPRERHVRPSTYPPSPDSDSAEYEQPIANFRAELSSHDSPHDDIFAQPSTSSRTKLLCDEEMEGLSDAEFEEMINAEMIYASNSRGIGSTTCRIHGPYNPLPEPAPSSMSSSLLDEPVGSSPFQFNEITWGRCQRVRLQRRDSLSGIHSSRVVYFTLVFL